MSEPARIRNVAVVGHRGVGKTSLVEGTVASPELAALAIENGAELCSADADFSRFPRLKWTDPTRAA